MPIAAIIWQVVQVDVNIALLQSLKNRYDCTIARNGDGEQEQSECTVSSAQNVLQPMYVSYVLHIA